MKAVISPKSGSPDVLQYKELEQPQPKPNELLIKVHFASVTSGDTKVRRFNRVILTIVGWVAGFKPMRIPGVEYARIPNSSAISRALPLANDSLTAFCLNSRSYFCLSCVIMAIYYFL
jgi:hypothetical protein